MRNKLIELLKDAPKNLAVLSFETLADHLIANGVTVQQWIPTSERLPDKGGYYLICQKHEDWFDEVVQTARYNSKTENFRGAQSGCFMEYVTHWMPLPEPPKEEV